MPYDYVSELSINDKMAYMLAYIRHTTVFNNEQTDTALQPLTGSYMTKVKQIKRRIQRLLVHLCIIHSTKTDIIEFKIMILIQAYSKLCGVTLYYERPTHPLPGTVIFKRNIHQ